MKIMRVLILVLGVSLWPVKAQAPTYHGYFSAKKLLDVCHENTNESYSS
jgi:hypothetical protein